MPSPELTLPVVPAAEVSAALTDLLRLVRLSPLMEISGGSPEVVVGLIDGPVDVHHPDLAQESLRALPGRPAACAFPGSSCVHGTFVAGVLAGRRGTGVAAICPGCTLLLRPIFGDRQVGAASIPTATPKELASAIVECIDFGAHVLNVSAAVAESRTEAGRELGEALDLAARRGVIVVAAAGNGPAVATSSLTRHPWVIPVAAYSRAGRPSDGATLGGAIGRRGLGAPGEDVTSLAPGAGRIRLGGSSAAAPFVTGAAALVWSVQARAPGRDIRSALVNVGRRRRSISPPLLDAWSAYRAVERSFWR